MNYKELIESRDVAVVGNASYEVLHKEISTYIIRCNDIGNNFTNVLYWDGRGDVTQYSHFKHLSYIFIFALRDDAREVAELATKHGIPYSLYCVPITRNGKLENLPNMAGCLELQQRLGCRPYTGFIAIQHALDAGARSVYVTGFDFYQEKFGKIIRQNGVHDNFAHIELMREWLEQGKISVDERLGELLQLPLD